MQQMLKLELKIKEFQDAVQNDKYDSVIEKLLRKIDVLKIGISFWQREFSKADDTNGIYYLWIKSKTENKKEIIFDIMHELGHCLDPIKIPLDDRYNEELRKGREVRAWRIADQ
ncbi:hypothetical protein Q5H93_04675 [Hymenobacter sp. ASUV-10]|uniref:ImmA/IrrE family metallo-endopeptidase n=1 Tax=Hymenobacter aranciens TaxID=3063996 RepID=A0ABT9B6W2_9BACT|nr:hypothetical protein [Hymenobacter sp. ASUV-10]MDO7874019.1 hypothetical protein [Hymenobacter sp. ASUV-10]